MTVRVLLFARARDLAGQPSVEITLPEHATVADLRRTLGEAHPSLLPVIPRLHVAINNDYAADSDPVSANAEIACFPPVSGG